VAQKAAPTAGGWQRHDQRGQRMVSAPLWIAPKPLFIVEMLIHVVETFIDGIEPGLHITAEIR
jgi:hypothetical protein